MMEMILNDTIVLIFLNSTFNFLYTLTKYQRQWKIGRGIKVEFCPIYDGEPNQADDRCLINDMSTK